MSLATQISTLAMAIGANIKALTSRVTAVEARTPVVVLTQAQYTALSSPVAGTVYVISG